MKVILDTNTLMMPEQFKIDIIDEIRNIIPNAEFVVIDGTIRELSQIKEKKAVNIALKIIEKCGIKKIITSGKTDDAIIKYALENKAVVATNDGEMKQKCKKLKIPIISMKKKKTLEIEGI